MLHIENLSVLAEEKCILKNFNLEIKDSEIHVLMGPNGAGKSTVCKSIMHQNNYQITEGKIVYNGVDITHSKTFEVARLGVYYLSQSPIEIEGITNAELLRAAMNERGIKMDIFEFNRKCLEVCQKLDLPKSFLHRHVNVGMSGGERKKCELLHLFLLEPSLVLLDEIDSGLDVDALKVVAQNLKEYVNMTHASLLVITHQQTLIDLLEPDQVHILKEGKIIETGKMDLAKKIEKFGFSGANNVSGSDLSE